MKVCNIDGCEKEHRAKGYCKSHYDKLVKYGDPLFNTKQSNNSNTKQQKTNRKPVKPYEDNHKMIDGVECKLCNTCNIWLPMNEEYYYKNNKNGIDGFNPYCKECTKKKSVKWVKDNPEQYKQLKKKYNSKEESREKHLQRTKRWRDNGKHKEYQKNNPDKFIVYHLKRQAKHHDISKSEWQSCKNYFDNNCAYCGISEPEAKEKYGQNFHREHVNPKGANDLSNCIPACRMCNVQKWEHQLTDWFNEKNKNYTIHRLNKINKWLTEDYLLYIEKRGGIIPSSN